MESVTSMMSVTANDGVRNLDDDDIDIAEHSAETSAQIFEIANKFSELLQDQDETDHAATVNSPSQGSFLSLFVSTCIIWRSF